MVLVISGFFTRRGISLEIIRNLGTSFQKCLSALSWGQKKMFKECEFERASNYEPARGALAVFFTVCSGCQLCGFTVHLFDLTK